MVMRTVWTGQYKTIKQQNEERTASKDCVKRSGKISGCIYIVVCFESINYLMSIEHGPSRQQ